MTSPHLPVAPPRTGRIRWAGALSAAALAVAALAAGCGSEPADPNAATPPSAGARPGSGSASVGASPGSPSVPADAVHLQIRLSGGTVSPDGTKISVRKNQTVVLSIQSDHEDEVHVHGGYNIEVPVAAGQAVTRSFVADQTGSVEVESHHPQRVLAILNVR